MKFMDFSEPIFIKQTLNHWSASLCHSLVRHTNMDLQPSGRSNLLSSKEHFRLGTSIIIAAFILSSCSLSKQISKQATNLLLKDSAINTGHIGISIYEPATDQYWYNYDATKYYVPASNTKLFTLYAGMKYLGDSLIGLRYVNVGYDSIKIFPTGDPTFLHPEFSKHPVFNLLVTKKYFTFYSQYFTSPLGKGWAWDDYQNLYMVQRSEFPIYGNLVRIYRTETGFKTIPKNIHLDIDKSIENFNDTIGFSAFRDWNENKIFLISNYLNIEKNEAVKIPIVAGLYDMPRFLMDTLNNNMTFGSNETYKNNDPQLSIVYSQPSDSLYKSMMHRSDNFFAEQTLLMAGNELLGYMDDEKMIDTILKTGLSNIPQKPTWVDGSGLSRYNLFTPQSFVYLLNKMKNEFGLERLKNILPTGGEGTLSAFFQKDAGYIFAKTGTLSNHCALSGFIITRKNKLLIFSVLANHYQTNATPVRRAVEKFLLNIRDKY